MRMATSAMASVASPRAKANNRRITSRLSRSGGGSAIAASCRGVSCGGGSTRPTVLSFGVWTGASSPSPTECFGAGELRSTWSSWGPAVLEIDMSVFLEKQSDEPEDRHIEAEAGDRRMAEHPYEPQTMQERPQNQEDDQRNDRIGGKRR